MEVDDGAWDPEPAWVTNNDPYVHKNGFTRKFLEVCACADRITESQTFLVVVMMCILMAGVLVGLQTYTSLTSDPTVLVLDEFVQVVFIVECLAKILSCGLSPWMFFVGKHSRWNNFDFVIVVLCLPVWDPIFGGGASQVSLLRLARLARIFKIVKKIPQLAMILMGVVGGFKAIMYIVLLLTMVFYLYAILGILLFRSNDPFHFTSLSSAMLALFRCATLEDWTDIMYVNMYGCAEVDQWDNGVYPSVAIATANFTASPFPDRYCDHALSQGRPIASISFFVTFICLSNFVMLALFIGAVSMSMGQALEDMKHREAAKKRANQMEKMRKLLSADKASELGCFGYVRYMASAIRYEGMRMRALHWVKRAWRHEVAVMQMELEAGELAEQGKDRAGALPDSEGVKTQLLNFRNVELDETQAARVTKAVYQALLYDPVCEQGFCAWLCLCAQKASQQDTEEDQEQSGWGIEEFGPYVIPAVPEVQADRTPLEAKDGEPVAGKGWKSAAQRWSDLKSAVKESQKLWQTSGAADAASALVMLMKMQLIEPFPERDGKIPMDDILRLFDDCLKREVFDRSISHYSRAIKVRKRVARIATFRSAGIARQQDMYYNGFTSQERATFVEVMERLVVIIWGTLPHRNDEIKPAEISAGIADIARAQAQSNPAESPSFSGITAAAAAGANLVRATSIKIKRQATTLARKANAAWFQRLSACAGAHYSRFVVAPSRILVNSKRFNNFITAVIMIQAVLVGIQTDPALEHDRGLEIADAIVLSIFTAEIVGKVLAEGPQPLLFFRPAWNRFDFVVVFLSFAIGGGAVTVLRLLRLLRLLKLVKALPQLQVIVLALLKGFASIGYIGVILFIFFYVYSVLGHILFSDNDPWHFGQLHTAILSLFRCATLEDWTDIMYINM